ncbi:SusC/RagA family TonB-linked outer membrane protein [Echinicola strongylocentroti]|uniref:SusC/RagA family TonB-linked outer membrane protein n=1 Tax=Echinicola strongylocentroti TaxID=1795355 RepID=A0A2Z4IDH9_9BACT|nr:TonB-dependent receptor [Echinicola strongylocentroti]AWW28676.1 SusC/RagA family TonB-linked outer membrane protein [Echinicola strongylocentroti]
MKKKIPYLIRTVSRNLLYAFAMQIICLSSLTANEISTQIKSIDKTFVDVEERKWMVGGFFKHLESKTAYYFVYPQKLNLDEHPIQISGGHRSVNDILVEIAQNAGLKFKQVNNSIYVGKAKPKDSSAPISIRIALATLTGRVLDDIGAPIPGATVQIEGTTSGTVTDVDGNFTLEVNEGDVVIISFLGYESQKITIGNQSTIEVTLTEDLSSLEEVVVVGYGTARRKDISGAVNTIDLEDSPLSLSPNTNPLQALRGNVPGVNVGAQRSPGTNPDILVRGQNSINGSNAPLIVVDGIIYLGDLADISPDDIASMDVLKDASSAAVYGSRAANGVIAITTKKGKTDKPVIRFNTSVGINQWPSPPNMMDTDRWTQKYVAQTPSIDSPDEIIFDDVTRTELFAQGVNTNWMDLISRNGFLQNYQLAVSGRSESVNYYLSGGYNHNEGTIIGDNYERISIRTKVDANITDWLEVGVDGTYNRNDYSDIGASVGNAYGISPFGYPYRWDQMPNNVASASGTLLERYPTGSSLPNPLWGTDGTIDDVDVRHFFRLATYGVLSVPKIEGLTYRFNFSINSYLEINDRFYYEDYYVGEQLEQPYIDRYTPSALSQRLPQANGYNNHTKRYSYVLDNIINYKKQIGNHYLDLTLVATRDFTHSKLNSSMGSDYSANGNTLLGVNGIHKATVQRVDLDIVERANIGYLGRLGYAFRDKYHLNATLRRDGASVFGQGNKWGNFPSLGVAWTASEEPFLKGSKVLDYLKLKASYGRNGNQGISPYGSLARVASGSDGGIRYEFGDAPSTILYGIAQSNLASPNLGWETTTSFNGGLQSEWLDNRLLFELDFYYSKTTDQIFQRQIPIMTGFGSIVSSLGQVNNRGVEVNLKSINISNEKFKWSSGLIFWQNRNKIVSLYGDDIDGDGSEDDDISNGLFIGKSLGAIYGYDFIGVVQEDDTEYIENVGAVPGDPKFQDISGPEGIPDGIITADYDRKILGYRKENFRLSLSNTFEYSNFSLYVMVTGIFGGGEDNFYLKENPRYNSFRDRFDTNEIDHDWWTPENKSNTYLRPDYVGTRYLGLQSRGFVRIQDVNLSYRVPRNILEKYRINSLELYSSIQNLHVFTDWFGGGDPEAGKRPDDSLYPVPRTFSMGLKVSF